MVCSDMAVSTGAAVTGASGRSVTFWGARMVNTIGTASALVVYSGTDTNGNVIFRAKCGSAAGGENDGAMLTQGIQCPLGLYYVLSGTGATAQIYFEA